jgi:phosphoketolase
MVFQSKAPSARIRCPSPWTRTHPEHLQLLEDWLKSYRPEELFDEQGRLRPELAELAPKGERRMGANPHANGGLLLRDLVMPDFRDYAVKVPSPGSVTAADTHELGVFLRDVAKLNQAQRNFRIFGPDETLSNRLNAVFEVTNRQWDARTWDNDEFLAREGRVMEMLSEHQCQGWLEGYLLTGRHGLFNCYEAFIHIIDSMFNQHAKWLKVTLGLPWRRKIASLNYLLASHVWQQMHNGFTHQDPGFIDHVVNKKSLRRARLSAAGRQLSAVGLGPLFAQPPLRQRGDRGQVSGAAVADDGRRREALHRRYRHLATGPATTRGCGPRRGHGLLWRCAHAGDPGRRLHPAQHLPD